MVVGSRTFTDDLLRRLGWENAHDDAEDRCPKVDVAKVDDGRADLVLLSDERYGFTGKMGWRASSALHPSRQRLTSQMVRAVAAGGS